MSGRLATLLAALAAVLVGCGGPSTPAPSAPNAGTLLLAPLQVSLAGQRLSLQAAPVVSACRNKQAGCQNLLLTVKLLPSLPPQTQAKAKARKPPVTVPAVNVQQVYLVTEGGVWQSGVRPQDVRRLKGGTALNVTVRGQADLRPKQAAQVVVQFKDAQGRVYLLRDQGARVRVG